MEVNVACVAPLGLYRGYCCILQLNADPMQRCDDGCVATVASLPLHRSCRVAVSSLRAHVPCGSGASLLSLPDPVRGLHGLLSRLSVA